MINFTIPDNKAYSSDFVSFFLTKLHNAIHSYIKQSNVMQNFPRFWGVFLRMAYGYIHIYKTYIVKSINSNEKKVKMEQIVLQIEF